MRIVFMGTPEPAAFALEELIKAPDPVVGVVTQPDRPAGRGQQRAPSPVRSVAESRRIPVLAPDKIRDPEFLNALRNWAPDLIVVVAYGRILPRSILDLPLQGCINVHYSLLPKYRGAAPVAWTIINGEEKSGVTTIKLVEEMDAGPILLQEEMPVASEETRASLEDKLAPVGARLLLETIRRLKDGGLAAKPQNDSAATYAPMLKKEDGAIDWGQPSASIERQVRAFNPWPSAYTFWRGKRLKVHRAKVVGIGERHNPGEIVKADQGGLWVATGDGLLSLEEVQMENRKRLPAVEFLKGAKVETGERL